MLERTIATLQRFTRPSRIEAGFRNQEAKSRTQIFQQGGNSNRLIMLKRAGRFPQKVLRGFVFPVARLGLQAIYAPGARPAVFIFSPLNFNSSPGVVLGDIASTWSRSSSARLSHLITLCLPLDFHIRMVGPFSAGAVSLFDGFNNSLDLPFIEIKVALDGGFHYFLRLFL